MIFANEAYLGKMHVVSKDSKYYPQNLKNIKGAPKKLYVIGNLNILNHKSIAIVGDRALSESGKRLDHACTKYYVNHGFVTIGGLARGADSESCKETLANNGQNISILAGGLDQPIYPPENKRMAKEVVNKGGAIVSPYPLGTRIRGYQFVQRDAWQSGMSNGVLAVQARVKSGTRHTMEFANQQHKPLAVPDYQKMKPEIVQYSGETQYAIKNHLAQPLTNIKSMKKFMNTMNDNYQQNHKFTNQKDINKSVTQSSNVKDITGDLFKSHAQTLVNTVNTVGAMGAGIALKFKLKYPNMYKQYRSLCRQHKIRVGHPWLYKPKDKNKQWVLNFPTKEFWGNPSKMSYVESGLQNLQKNYQKWGIKSIAVPPLGAGLGGLDWSKVKPLTDKYLSQMNIKTYEYQPLPNNRYYQHNFHSNKQSKSHQYWWHGKANVYYLDKQNNVKKQMVTYNKMPYRRGVSHYSRRYAQSISSKNLHQAFMKLHPQAKPIEISSASKGIGASASAMNLNVVTSKGTFKAEQLYQAGKVFKGQSKQDHDLMAHQILSNSPWQAKRYLPRRKPLKEFELFGHKFPLTPKNYYYDNIYLHGLLQHPQLRSNLSQHNTYTDVYANRNVVNTQAKSCAIYHSLTNKYGLKGFNKIINNPTKFKQVETEIENNETTKTQHPRRKLKKPFSKQVNQNQKNARQDTQLSLNLNNQQNNQASRNTKKRKQYQMKQNSIQR